MKSSLVHADAAVRAGDFAKALTAADRGIKFDPGLLLVNLNRAHTDVPGAHR